MENDIPSADAAFDGISVAMPSPPIHSAATSSGQSEIDFAANPEIDSVSLPSGQIPAPNSVNDSIPTASPSEDVEFGRWFTANTLKMMEKMGYKKGSGLGKNEQGAATFTEPKPRVKRKMGMGFEHTMDSTAELKKRIRREIQDAGTEQDPSEVVDRLLENELFSGDLTLNSLLWTFKYLKEKVAVYRVCNLSVLACKYAYPLMVEVFKRWEPLQNPVFGVELMTSWRDLCDGMCDTFDDNVACSPYDLLVTEIVLPPLRLSAMKWHAREPEPMLKFLESWDFVLPPSAVQGIMESIVIPKLSAAVESWDPRRDGVPIHVWVYPWLPWLGPLLGKRLEVLYAKIRHKMENVDHDGRAYDNLSLWNDVFDATGWEPLLSRYIVPKLMSVLQEVCVNPLKQTWEQYNWVRMWATVIPIQHLVTILDAGFFSRKHQDLYHRFSGNPNYIEVAKWFQGLYSFFPHELLASGWNRAIWDAGLYVTNPARDNLMFAR